MAGNRKAGSRQTEARKNIESSGNAGIKLAWQGRQEQERPGQGRQEQERQELERQEQERQQQGRREQERKELGRQEQGRPEPKWKKQKFKKKNISKILVIVPTADNIRGRYQMTQSPVQF
jgi:hypothetical protein